LGNSYFASSLYHRIRFIDRRGKERERERKRKSNFDAGKNHATTIIVGTPVAAIEPVLGDAGDDAIASV
jgi:hypothetical protein